MHHITFKTAGLALRIRGSSTRKHIRCVSPVRHGRWLLFPSNVPDGQDPPRSVNVRITLFNVFRAVEIDLLQNSSKKSNNDVTIVMLCLHEDNAPTRA